MSSGATQSEVQVVSERLLFCYNFRYLCNFFFFLILLLYCGGPYIRDKNYVGVIGR